ncbi:MAG: Ig-like domain-containing protein, partial [Leptospira sp.]|nr:Ig-like domain-containing protein [Leptospira sp.]
MRIKIFPIYFLSVIAALYFSCNNVEDKLKALAPPSESPGAPKVVSSLPAANQDGVDKNQALIFTFNKEVDPQTCMNAFTMQPPITGLYDFTGPIMKFKPSAKLRGGITYVASLSRRCEDKEGRDLEAPYSVSFTVSKDTTTPTLVSVQAKTNATGCSQASPLIEIVNFQSNYYSTKNICKDTPVVLNFS